MGLTRRDFFTLGLGAAAAIPLTPVPWKLLDDTSKWSQNWSWIPRPPRGEPSVRYSSCTLCLSGCGIQARCVGKNVIGIAPVPGHPVSKGVLCAYAFGAHQLPYHAARITEPLHRGNATTLDKASQDIASRMKTGRVAILDERPGRAVSDAYQRIATAHGGLYIVAGRRESATLRRIASHAGLNEADLGLDLEKVRTLVSFGAPVLESWATPGRVLTLWKEKRLDIIQIEPELSKTAALASQWIPATSPDSGVIRSIRDRGPILAMSGGSLPDSEDERIAALNQGSPGIVRRSAAPAIASTRLSSVPDDSIDVLFIDHGPLGGSLPFDAIRRKLRPAGIIVSLSPYRAGVPALADYVIPAPSFGESLDEAPTPWDAAVPSYAVAPALLDPPPGAIRPLEFIDRVTGGEATPEVLIRARVGSLYTAKRGEIFTFVDRATKPVAQFKSAGDLWKAFTAGACWIDPGAKPVPIHGQTMRGTNRNEDVVLAARPAVAPPLFTERV